MSSGLLCEVWVHIFYAYFQLCGSLHQEEVENNYVYITVASPRIEKGHLGKPVCLVLQILGFPECPVFHPGSGDIYSLFLPCDTNWS